MHLCEVEEPNLKGQECKKFRILCRNLTKGLGAFPFQRQVVYMAPKRFIPGNAIVYSRRDDFEKATCAADRLTHLPDNSHLGATRIFKFYRFTLATFRLKLS